MFFREYKRENTLFTMMPFVEIFISQKFQNRGMTQSFVRNTNDARYILHDWWEMSRMYQNT